jgi:preprotein translocase subunit SecF
MAQHKFFSLVPHGTRVDFVKLSSKLVIGSAAVVALALVGVVAQGFRWGVEFTGGTEIQVAFSQPVTDESVRAALQEAKFNNPGVQRFGAAENNEFLLRVERISVLTPESLKQVEEGIRQRLGDQVLDVVATEKEGDRITVFLKGVVLPTPAESTDGGASPPPVPGQPTALNLDDKQLEPHGLLLEEAVKAAGLELRGGESRKSLLSTNKEEHYIFVAGVSSRVVEALKLKLGDIVTERRTDYVDATVAGELRTDGILALLYALGVMLLYIAIRFDFYFSPGAIVALFHDVLVAVGVISWLRLDFDLTLVAALLTIIGYSINDTIVVYDRVRELLTGKETYAELCTLVNRSINDTLSRTIITSGTTFLVAISLYIWGGRVLEGFALAMCVGVITGTYSSFAIATPVYLFLKRKYPHGILQAPKA